MRKGMNLGRRYFIINIDEPYAKAVYEVLKAGQIAKGEWPEGDISFKEWEDQTFNHLCCNCGNSKWKNSFEYGTELHCKLEKVRSVVFEDETCEQWKPKKMRRGRVRSDGKYGL